MTEEQAGQVLTRVGALMVMYDADMQAFDPDFDLPSEIDWCLESLTGEDPAELARLRELCGRAILDPTGHRRPFCAALYILDTAG